MAFGKVELLFIDNLTGRTIEKHAQNYGKNFPVNETWVPAFAGMTPVWGNFLGQKANSCPGGAQWPHGQQLRARQNHHHPGLGLENSKGFGIGVKSHKKAPTKIGVLLSP
jgi:hypothetical protein